MVTWHGFSRKIPVLNATRISWRTPFVDSLRNELVDELYGENYGVNVEERVAQREQPLAEATRFQFHYF